MEGNAFNRPWYAHEDDCNVWAHFWCVMAVDEPPSHGARPVAAFMEKEVAEYIAALHNEWRGPANDQDH